MEKLTLEHFQHLEHKRAWVIGLLTRCPLDKALDDCPAKDIRSLSDLDRMNLVDRMDENQLDEIIAHHRKCLREREGS